MTLKKELNDAIKKNDHIKVKELLSNDKLKPQSHNNSAIILAAQKGSTESFQLLLNDKRVDPTCQVNHAFIKAVYNNRIEIVKLLLKDKRIDPSVPNNNALLMSSNLTKDNIILLLLEDGRVDPTIHNNLIINCAIDNKNIPLLQSLWKYDSVKIYLEKRHPSIYNDLKINDLKKIIINF